MSNDTNFSVSENNSIIETTTDFLSDASGPVRFSFTNDYMFKSICQKNLFVLKGLLSSLLHISADEIAEINILNPIQPGDYIDEKSCILDVKVLMNNSRIINIEMQVTHESDWVERSLVYLCRIVSQQLKPGESYGKMMDTMHIGLLDFTLFEHHQEFYSHYLLTEERTGHIYTGKFALSVVELNQIDKATEEDIRSGLRDWARLFKAKTWEEIKMVAQQNEWMKSAAVTLKELTAEEKIQMQCEARERYERDRVSLLYEGRKEGIKEGRRLEKARADAAEARADEAEARAAEAEAKIRELEAKLKELNA